MAELQLTPVLNSDPRFVLFAEATQRLSNFDLSPILVYLIDSVDESALYFLAEQFSILGYDGWSLAESEEQKRELIKSAIELHRYKGTPWAIRHILRIAGFGEIEVIENIGRLRHRGIYLYDGSMQHGGPTNIFINRGSFSRRGTHNYAGEKLHGTYGSTYWATYAIKFFKPIKNNEVGLIKRVLENFAPARCKLMWLDYTQSPINHSGLSCRDGSYNYGTVL